MNATNTLDNMPSTPTNTKPLWATIGVLGVSVLAMGASLVSIYQRPTVPAAIAAKPSANALASPANVITEMADGAPVLKAAPDQQNKAQTATKNVVKTSPAKTAAQTTVHAGTTAHGAAAPAPQAATPAVLAQAQVPVPTAAPVCANCGTVEAVTPVTRQGKGSGAGAVAGGVVGAVLGNQVGQGDGRTVATILGAVGGGLAGNAIEKNTKKTTVYEIKVRMDDGSVRSFEEASAPAVGAKVKVEGAALRTADGSLHAPLPVPSPRAAPQPQANVYNGR